MLKNGSHFRWTDDGPADVAIRQYYRQTACYVTR